MSLLWESLATRDTTLLRHSMAHRFAIHPDTQWVNYVRCHDDIGWTFSDEDALAVGIRGFDHRQFLNRFYTGRFEGAFARGVPFQLNPKTLDCRVCGSAASLAGLEKALAEETLVEVDLAIRRILLLYSVAFSIGGIPLVYLGDELAVLNDYSYASDPDKHDDSRWVQRPRFEAATFAARTQEGTPAHAVFGGFRRMVVARQSEPALGGHGTVVLDAGDSAVFAYRRECAGARVLVLNNFSERHVQLDAALLLRELGAPVVRDLLRGERTGASGMLELAPYDALWLKADA
jgi:amylosucrase